MFHALKTTSVLVKKREKGSEVIAEKKGASDEDKDYTFIIRRRLNVLG